MQTKKLTSLNRAGLLVLAALIILLVSLFLVNIARSHKPKVSSTTPVVPSSTSDISRMELADGQQMGSDSYNFTTDVTGPSAMHLPLKTLQDFPASSSAQTAHITTSKGVLTVELFQSLAPLTVANFVTLARTGFYDDLHFHRVVPNFVAQIGDPASRGVTDPVVLDTLGTGYPDYRIEDEFGAGLSHDGPGYLSMANINLDGSYPNSGGSQFFITLAPLTYLDGRHAIFGRVSEGLEILPRLEVGDAIQKITFDDN